MFPVSSVQRVAPIPTVCIWRKDKRDGALEPVLLSRAVFRVAELGRSTAQSSAALLAGTVLENEAAVYCRDRSRLA